MSRTGLIRPPDYRRSFHGRCGIDALPAQGGSAVGGPCSSRGRRPVAIRTRYFATGPDEVSPGGSLQENRQTFGCLIRGVVEPAGAEPSLLALVAGSLPGGN